MKKCKCTKESYCLVIDDSNKRLKGRKVSFNPGKIYEYKENVCFLGKEYSIIPKKGRVTIELSEKEFLSHFDII